MSACAELNRVLDLSCSNPKKKYIQRVVLMNRADINQSYFQSDFVTYNRLTFNLVDGAQGYPVATSDIANIINANFSKSEQNGIPVYTHRVQFPIVGATEYTKVMLKQLDSGDLFAAMQFTDFTVEIYGFNFGLKTVPYQYSAGNNLGGSVLTMESRVPEYEPPFMYYPSTPSFELTDDEAQALINFNFDNNFKNIEDFLCGDFNLDFNDDFNNSCDDGASSSAASSA